MLCIENIIMFIILFRGWGWGWGWGLGWGWAQPQPQPQKTLSNSFKNIKNSFI